jgi:hypothetical protein
MDKRLQYPIECRNKARHAPQGIITTLSNYHVLALRSIYVSTYRFDSPLYFFKCATKTKGKKSQTKLRIALISFCKTA